MNTLTHHQITSKSKHRTLLYWVGRALLYIALLLGVYILCMPLAWMIVTSLKEPGEVFSATHFFPKKAQWSNYADLFMLMPFGRYILNTMFITCASMLGQVLVSALVAYGFARLDFPGKNGLFIVMLSTMMLPYAVTMIPQYFIYGKLGWHDSYLPLILPSFFGNAFFIFLYRQFFQSISKQLDEAADIDGCGKLGVFLRIILPMSLPVVGTISIFSFNNNWNDFMGPMLYINDESKRTVQLGINAMRGLYTTNWPYLMAGSIVVLMPVMLLFFLFQRTMIQGVVVTGLKG